MGLLDAQIEAVRSAMPLRVVGRIEGVTGLGMEAADLSLPMGALCRVEALGAGALFAEVVGFRHNHTVLTALTEARGVARGDRVEGLSACPRVWVSDELLGRVIDGFGRPIDGGPPLRLCASRRIDGRGVPALNRRPIDRPVATGIRAIDGLHTCGMGQRLGIFSGPGVGKSTLVASIARHTSADVSVVALIGERAREVKDFLSRALGPKGLARSVVVVSTSDDPPPLRIRAARVAATVCEYFRDQGRDVVLVLDSLTRLAHAQRQIGVTAHEPPATRGYPPSVFSLLPELLERSGNTERGSITGFYTILVEGDDFNEPIADAVKGISDGHLWLSRTLANRGQYPAIDVLQSISRVRNDVVDADQQRAARRVLSLLATYQEIEDMVTIGAYRRGMSVENDLAVQCRPMIIQYLRQEPDRPCTLDESRRQLLELEAGIDRAEQALRSQAGRGGAQPPDREGPAREPAKT